MRERSSHYSQGLASSTQSTFWAFARRLRRFVEVPLLGAASAPGDAFRLSFLAAVGNRKRFLLDLQPNEARARVRQG